jgi:multidrug transporter EmrE-like cation transporter
MSKVAVFCFSMGWVAYVAGASLPFLPLARSMPKAYFAIGLALGLLTSFLWLFLAKSLHRDAVMLTSLYWDAMLAATYVLVPALAFGTPTTSKTWAGILLVLAGITLTKI